MKRIEQLMRDIFAFGFLFLNFCLLQLLTPVGDWTELYT